MLATKEQRIEKKIAKETTVWEYKLNCKEIGMAVAKINGRFPDFGRVTNKECQEIYYCFGGSGQVFVNNKKIELKEGDTLLIKPRQKYYVIGSGLEMVIPTSPSWYPEQFESCD